MRKDTPYGKMSSGDRRRSSKWDSKEESHIALENMHDSGKSEPLSGRTASQRDDNSIDEDRNRNSKGMTSWEEEDSYGTQMSPGLDDWRQQKTHQKSPINKLKRSRSPSQGRSRSRSPIRGFGRESGLNDRSRSTFTARRGNQSQFFHGQPNEGSWERQRKTMTPKYPMPSDSREYPLGSNKSTNLCTEFLKGSCRRGSSCRFAHHGASIVSGKMSSDESTRRPRDDREPRRATDIPCKFFAAGNCRNGKFCRFSHQDQSYPTPDESQISLDHGAAGETRGHGLEQDKKLSDPLIDVRVVENKKNEVLLWGNGADDDSKLVGENWLGDMDMSPEWNYKVQTPKPIDKPSELNLAVIGFSALSRDDKTMSGTPGSRGIILPSFNQNGPSPNLLPPQIQDEKAINRPDIVKPTSISSEQLTTISASIAQLLANGLPFQQLQGSLAQTTIQTSPFHNEGPMGMQKQYDPTIDSIEVEKHEVSNNPPGFFPTQEFTGDVKLEVIATENSDNKNNNGKEEANDTSCQVIQLEPGPASAEESTILEEQRDAKDNSPLENIDGDGKAEDVKRGKETKGVKAFKFALVEFVKELLKPTWKEGQMSKDAYKNIVKKVVEKVTGTVQGDNIPQTQEKIQHYLSHSKPKLTKLVQAYVEKYEKDK